MTRSLVGYTTIREDFSEYKCDNGQILRVKTGITNIFQDEDGEKPKIGVDFRDVSKTFATEPVDTSDLESGTAGQVTDDDNVRELAFEVLKETANIYETDDLIIVLVPVMRNIYLTNKKDRGGDPILRYKIQNSCSIIDKKAFREGLPGTQAKAGQTPS